MTIAAGVFITLHGLVHAMYVGQALRWFELRESMTWPDGAVLMPGFAKLGVVPESGGTWYLPRLLGWAKACEVAMLGDTLDAEAAVAYGLANRAVAADTLETVTTEWAEKIAANAPLAITEMKRLFRHGLTQDFESHSHHVLMSVMNLFRSNDFSEGVRAFAEKRPPDFSGS